MQPDRDVTTVPAANLCTKSKLTGVVRATTGQHARALENPITRFIIECQSLFHLRSEYWTEEQAGPFFCRQFRNFERMRVLAGNTTKPDADVSPAIAETYQMIGETGNRR